MISVGADQLDTLLPGDRITAANGITLDPPHVVLSPGQSPSGPFALVNRWGTSEWVMFADQVGSGLTIDRPEPARPSGSVVRADDPNRPGPT